MIYLDNNATTRPTAGVVAAMLPYLTNCYFNASASTAAFTGADKPRFHAAAALAKLLNAEESDCFSFTSGATESNNWVFASFAKGRKTGRILISAIEHASVAEPATELARVGFEIVEIPVDVNGLVQLDVLRDALTEDTVLVSIMAANNETGVMEPIADIGQLIREFAPKSLFHTDATQVVGKIPVDLQGAWRDVDLLSFSAHKFHGPKGIGGLYIRPGFEVEPIILGGGQERGLRSGTTNTPALAGLAAAATEAIDLDYQKTRDLRDIFEYRLEQEVPDTVIHSRGISRLPNTSFFSLPGMVGDEVADTLAAAGIIIGTGAACSAGATRFSKTLRAMGVVHGLAAGALRVSLSKTSNLEDITSAIVGLKAVKEHQQQSL